MLYPKVMHDDGIWGISICREGDTLITCQQQSGQQDNRLDHKVQGS